MLFEKAFTLIVEGKTQFISRTSWGKKKVLWLKPKAVVKSEYCKDPILHMLAEYNGGEIKCEQVVCQFDNNEKKIMSGWIPQQDDLSADDWTEASITSDAKGIKIWISAKEEKRERYKQLDLFEDVDVIKK